MSDSIGDVAMDKARALAGLSDSLFGASLVDVADDDLSALFDEHDDRRPPDAGGGAGDDDLLAG